MIDLFSRASCSSRQKHEPLYQVEYVRSNRVTGSHLNRYCLMAIQDTLQNLQNG